MTFPRCIYFIPISLVLHACGGGDISPEEFEKELSSTAPPISVPASSPNPTSGRKGTMPVNCSINPAQCS